LALSVARRKTRQEAKRAAACSGPTGSGGDGSGDTGSGESALARSAPPASGGRGSPAPAASDGSGALTGPDSASVAPGGPAPPPVPPLGALFDDLFADCLAEPDASGPVGEHSFWNAAFATAFAPPPTAAGLAWPLHAPAAMQLPAALAALPWLAPARVELKLGGDSAPTHLPPAFAAAAAASLFVATPLAMTAAAQPGCTLLTLEAAVERERSGDACSDLQAGPALQQLLRHGGAGPYLRRVDDVALAAAGTVARATRGVVKEANSADAPAVPAAPRLPPLAVLAALRDAPTAVRAAAPLPASRGVRVRWHGHFLRADCDDASKAAVPAGHLRLAVPDGIAEGVALLERAVPDEDGISAPRGAPRPILLCSDVAIVSELNATANATSGDVMARDAAEEATILLGHAMRPGCAPQLAASAGGRCVQQGWAAAAARCAALLPAGSEHAPALAAALLAAFAGTSDAAAEAAADLAVAWLRASPARSGESAAATAMRAQLRAAAPLARAAAAAAAESHGVHYPPHVAEVASAELASRAASASPDARIVAALAAAQLRAAAAAWERAQADEPEPQTETTISPAVASLPPPSLDALARELVAPAPEVLSEPVWRFQKYRFSIELFAVYLIAYHAAQAVRGSATMPELHGRGEGVRLERAHILAIMDTVRHRLLFIQAPTTALLLLLLLLLCRRPWRALLAARLQALLALQFAVHALYATHEQAEMAQTELFAPAGIATVLLPLRFAAGLASFTLLCAWCCPLAPRWALPLFAARAALPVLNAARPRVAALMWPPTGGAGVALQCAACCAAAAHVVLRERRLQAEYDHYRTTAAAPRRRSKTD